MRIKIAPSILSADFSCLNKEIKKVEAAGADLIHVDVMDGHFVPNITVGPVVVKFIRKITKLPLDVHLMIENPEKFIDAFVEAGADMITVHIEAVSIQGIRAISLKLKKKEIKLGISLNPSTPLFKIQKALKLLDFVLVMSVNPGFGGQDFIPSAAHKIKQLRSVFDKDISVDGGINNQTAKLVIDAGANILAVGSHIFNSKNYKKTIRSLKNV